VGVEVDNYGCIVTDLDLRQIGKERKWKLNEKRETRKSERGREIHVYVCVCVYVNKRRHLPRHKSLYGNPPNLRRLSDDFDAS